MLRDLLPHLYETSDGSRSTYRRRYNIPSELQLHLTVLDLRLGYFFDANVARTVVSSSAHISENRVGVSLGSVTETGLRASRAGLIRSIQARHRSNYFGMPAHGPGTATSGIRTGWSCGPGANQVISLGQESRP